MLLASKLASSVAFMNVAAVLTILTVPRRRLPVLHCRGRSARSPPRLDQLPLNPGSGLVWLVVAAPVSVTLTRAVDATEAGAAGGVYRMLRVHEEPAATTRFAVHGVPVVPGPTVKVPEPLTGTIVAAVNVSGPAVAPVLILVTVSVPFFTVRSAAPVTSPVG